MVGCRIAKMAWLANYVKLNEIKPFKINFPEKHELICNSFYLTKVNENKIDLSNTQTTSFDEVHQKMPFVLKSNDEILDMIKTNKIVVEKFKLFNKSSTKVPIEWRAFEKNDNVKFDGSTLFYRDVLIEPGFSCVKTGLVFNVKKNMVLLFYPTVDENVLIHSFGIDSVDNGIVHFSMYNTTDETIKGTIECKIYLFHVTDCEETVSSKTVNKTKKSKIVNLDWSDIESVNMVNKNSATLINNRSYNSANLIVLPRKRAMMNEHFLSMGVSIKNKKCKEIVDFKFKTLSPFIISNAIAMICVKGQSAIEFVEKDFEIKSYKSILNGYYSKLPNYKEIVQTMEKQFKLKEKFTNLNDLFTKLSVGLNLSDEQKEFIKFSLRYLIKSKNPETLQNLIDKVKQLSNETISESKNDEKFCKLILKDFIDEDVDYFEKVEYLQNKLYSLSGYLKRAHESEPGPSKRAK